MPITKRINITERQGKHKIKQKVENPKYIDQRNKTMTTSFFPAFAHKMCMAWHEMESISPF